MESIIITNKKIIEFYNKYTIIDIERVNLLLIELYEEIINNMSGELNKNIMTEILSIIKTHGQEFDFFKNELKTEITNINTIQKITNINMISEINTIKDIMNKLNNDITNSIISKFYEIKKEHSQDLELIINKNSNDTTLKIIEKIEKEQENIINKTNLIIKEIIPQTQYQYYNLHEQTINNFKDDLTKNIENIKTSIKENKIDISLDKLNILINEKNNTLLNSVEHNVLNYITNSEERIKNNIFTIKDDKTMTELKNAIYNIKNDISINELTLSNNIQQTILNYIKISDERFKDDNIFKELKDELQNIKNDKLTLSNNLQQTVFNYITNSEERLKNDIITIKDDHTMKEIKDEINNIKHNITIDKLTESNNIQQTLLNYITNSEDRLKTNLNEIKNITNNNFTNQEQLNNNLQLFLNQYKVSSKKGEFGEKLLESILTNLFPSSEIINTTGQTSSGDFILKRDNKVKILIENKNYDSINVPKKEVDKFIFDIEMQNCCGILMSQKSGISLKNNFQIDIKNKNVLIYIHNMNYDSDKILLACDIIDNLTNKINELSNCDNTINISSNSLQLINEQYQRFIAKKEAIIFQINDNTKKIIESIKEMELGELNNILLNSFTNTKIQNFKCNICNIYIGSNNKALSNHKRYCKHKTKDITDETNKSTTDENNKDSDENKLKIKRKK
jgi:hypothetical protein